MDKKKKTRLNFKRVDIDNEEFISTNTTLTKAVQNFILSAKVLTED